MSVVRYFSKSESVAVGRKRCPIGGLHDLAVDGSAMEGSHPLVEGLPSHRSCLRSEPPFVSGHET